MYRLIFEGVSNGWLKLILLFRHSSESKRLLTSNISEAIDTVLLVVSAHVMVLLSTNSGWKVWLWLLITVLFSHARVTSHFAGIESYIS